MKNDFMPSLVFLYGRPAAGKTTFAKKFVEKYPSFVLISADEVRKELYGSEDIYGDGWVIYQEILKRIRVTLSSGQDVIYDATNLRKSYRMDYLNELTDIPCYKFIYCLYVDKEESIKRHLARGRNIPLESLMPLYDIIEAPSVNEGWDHIIFVST